MKNTLTKITSGFIFAIFTATICAPSAIAAPINEVPGAGSNFISQNATDKSANLESQTNKILSDLSVKSFSATIVLHETSGQQIIDAKNSKQSLSALLKTHGFDSSDFRSSSDTALDENYQLKDSENLTLFRSEASGTSSVVNLPAPVEKRNSADLYKGEEKVETEGKDGQALRTVITTKNLAADATVNASAKSANAETDSSEEKLTILSAPEAKVILVGTKERVTESSVATTPGATISQTAGNSQAYAPSTQSTATKAPTSSAPASSVASGSVAGLAMAQVGKAYVWGATGANAFDCSGLVQWVYASAGKSLPRTAYAQGLSGTPVSASDIQPGDVIYTSSHIAIYVGNGKIVHASTPSQGVAVDNLSPYLAAGYKISRL